LPASVRQLQQWIDTHVRFDTADEAVAELFPATAATLAQAEVEKAKVIPITHDYHVQPDAKDEDGGRTYGPTAWKRADGQPVMDRSGSEKPSKTCEYSTIGLIAVGEGRGESFLVCVDKKRCMTHWGDEIRERNKRERSRAAAPTNGNAGTKAKPEEQSWERQQRLSREQTSRAKARWEKGGDAVLRAVVPHVKKLTVGGATPATEYFLEVVEDGLYGIRDRGKEAVKLGIPRGSTATDLMRHLIMVSLLDQAEPGAYIASNEADLQGDLDALKIKIDVAKLLDAANPKKPETNQTDGKPSQKVGTSVAHKPRAKSSKPTTPSNAPAPKQAARKRSPSDFMKPQQPDAVLAAIVGDGPMPRTEIMKKMWNYITKHGLQDKKERRTIIADAKMKAVFGGKAKVSMFEMTKHLNKHLSRAVAP
jgi:chromatin remodeling complex protein RSC6